MSPKLNVRVVPMSEVPNFWEDEPTKAGDNRTDVLVVDDDRLVADTVTLILRHAGFRARTAYCGASAQTLVAARCPDLVLTDVEMPKMSGVELAMVFRETCPQVPVLLFSGRATAAHLAPARKAGVELRLLMKPVHPTELLAAVRQSLAEAESALNAAKASLTLKAAAEQTQHNAYRPYEGASSRQSAKPLIA